MPTDARLKEALDLLATQRFAEARRKLTPLVARDPDNTEARLALAMAQLKTGDPVIAEHACRKLLKEGRLENTLFSDACEILSQAGQLEEAMQFLIKGVEQHPEWAHPRVVLANWYNSVNDYYRAIAEAERILELSPEFSVEARRVLADAHRALGDHALALTHYRAVQWANPDHVITAESVAFIGNGVGSVTPQQSFQAHLKFAQLIENYAANVTFTHPRQDDPSRRLRIGFVSHDFSAHSVANFLFGLFENLDRDQFEVWGYYTGATVDQVTERLRAACSRFVHVPRITSVELAQRVHSDKADVLVDLNGLTLGHRLHAFQLRPAPLQITWLGYANTTGLRTIGYRFVDSITDPPGSDAFATERLIRLDPCFLCFTPFQQRPELVGPGWTPPSWSPAGHVRFACFNNIAKVTDQVLDIWAAVLARVPGSTISIKSRGLQAPESRQNLQNRLQSRGITPERVVALPPAALVKDHLVHYGQTDIALDTFPYNGTTTTCEALCCGVPVITYTGDRHAARVSASILHASTLPELVGKSADDMVEIATALATDTQRMHQLRTSTAERFRTAEICDGPAFSRRFGKAVREAWRARCEDAARER